MADIKQLESALIKADAAGNADDARALAAEIRRMRSEPVPEKQDWSDVPLSAIKNLPSSAGNFLGGIAQAVAHPIDTASGVLDAAAGGLKNITPKPLADFIGKADYNPQATDRAVQTADAVGKMYKDRYGSSEGIRNTLATDPVGAAADVSTLLGAGALLNSGKVGNALSRASQSTNPLSVAAPVARGIGKVAEPIGSNLLGLTTGVGPENIRMAARAGKEGKTAFMDNLSGNASMADVLDTAKQNVQNMGAERSAAYRADMANIKGDKTVLKFDKIDDAIKSANEAVSYKGQIKNAKGAQAAQEIADEINKWKSLDPAEFHTPEGLDALKQKIGGIVDSIPYEEKTARMVAGNLYNSVKSEIAAQAPTYAKTMKEYSEATDTIREIERALSLGEKASVDTAMRKLQSLSRNNVNTNYGNRLDLAKKLEQQGGNEILPAIAGQAMNSWAPRGLVGQGGSLATIGASLSNPGLAAMLPLQSPRAVGSALYGAGKATNALANLKTPLTAEQLKTLALVMNQANSVASEPGKNNERR